MILKNVRAFVGVSSVLALAASSFACSAHGGDELVQARVETVDRTHQALSTGALKWANGTYGAACQSHRGESWSARISGTDPMDNQALSVVKNDTACVLTLTSLVADAAYLAAPSIDMTDTYADAGSSFAVQDGNIAFYANAELSSTSFASDFTMTILFSDDLRSVSPSVTATYASVSGSASESQVPSPQYSLDFSGITLQTDIAGNVEAATGSVAVTALGQTGESYVINNNQSLGSTFADVDAAYSASSPATLGATIGMGAFGLTQLSSVRNLIISHTESGVTSYEVIRITFNRPALDTP